MANTSLKQSVTSLFAERDAWPEMRSNGTEEAKEIFKFYTVNVY